MKSPSPDPRDEGRGFQPFSTTLWCKFWARQSLLRSPQLYLHVVLWSRGCPSHCVGLPGRRYGSFSCWFGMVFVTADVKQEIFLCPALRRGRLPQDMCTLLRLYFLLFHHFLYFQVNHTKQEPGYGAHGWMGMNRNGNDALEAVRSRLV